MKTTFKLLILSLFIVTTLCAEDSLKLTTKEVTAINALSNFIDDKPLSTDLQSLVDMLKDKNLMLRSLSATILFKHYGDRFREPFCRAFTFNRKIELFKQEPITLINFENLSKMLNLVKVYTAKLEDPRVANLFLYLYFRNKNVWILADHQEKLSMAEFYRIRVFNDFISERFDPLILTTLIDQLQ